MLKTNLTVLDIYAFMYTGQRKLKKPEVLAIGVQY